MDDKKRLDAAKLYDKITAKLSSMSKEESDASLRRAEEDSSDSYLMGDSVWDQDDDYTR